MRSAGPAEPHGAQRNAKIWIIATIVRKFPSLFGFWRRGVAVARQPFGGFVVIRWDVGVGATQGHLWEMRSQRRPPEPSGISRNSTERQNRSKRHEYTPIFPVCGSWHKCVAAARKPFGGFSEIRWALGLMGPHIGEMSAKRKPRNATERRGPPKYGYRPLAYTHFPHYLASVAGVFPSPVAPFGGFAVIRWASVSIEGHMGERRANRNPRNPPERHGSPKWG